MHSAMDSPGGPFLVGTSYSKTAECTHSHVSYQKVIMLEARTFLLLIICCCHVSEAAKGIDVSSLVYPKDFECLKNQGYDFLIVRGYRSVGSPDPNAIHTIANAREAGFKYIDVYLFPCPRCSKSASEQVDEMGI